MLRGESTPTPGAGAACGEADRGRGRDPGREGGLRGMQRSLRKFTSSRFGVWQNFSKFGLCLKTTQSVLNSFENFFENYSFIILCGCIDICNCLDFLFYASGSITEHVRGDRYVADKFS